MIIIIFQFLNFENFMFMATKYKSTSLFVTLEVLMFIIVFKLIMTWKNGKQTTPEIITGTRRWYVCIYLFVIASKTIALFDNKNIIQSKVKYDDLHEKHKGNVISLKKWIIYEITFGVQRMSDSMYTRHMCCSYQRDNSCLYWKKYDKNRTRQFFGVKV